MILLSFREETELTLFTALADLFPIVFVLLFVIQRLTIPKHLLYYEIAVREINLRYFFLNTEIESTNSFKTAIPMDSKIVRVF